MNTSLRSFGASTFAAATADADGGVNFFFIGQEVLMKTKGEIEETRQYGGLNSLV